MTHARRIATILIACLLLAAVLIGQGPPTRKVQYIDATYGNDANDGSSWEEAYKTLAGWEAQDTDLVTANQYLDVYCRGGQELISATVTIQGWGTNATHPIKVIEDPNNYHNGVWSTTAYSIKWNNASAGGMVVLNQAYLTFDGIELEGKRTSNYNYHILTAGDYAGLVVRNCLIRRALQSSYAGINIVGGTSAGRYIYNNTIWGCRVGILISGVIDGGVFHNTIRNCPVDGIRINAGAGNATVCKNNLISGCGVDYQDDYPSALHVSLYNYVSDTSLPAGQEAYESQIPDFADEDANDFHLKRTEYYKFNASDPAVTGLNKDIDGQGRLRFHAGSDEVMKPGSRFIGHGAVLLRRIHGDRD